MSPEAAVGVGDQGCLGLHPGNKHPLWRGAGNGRPGRCGRAGRGALYLPLTYAVNLKLSDKVNLMKQRPHITGETGTTKFSFNKKLLSVFLFLLLLPSPAFAVTPALRPSPSPSCGLPPSFPPHIAEPFPRSAPSSLDPNP